MRRPLQSGRGLWSACGGGPGGRAGGEESQVGAAGGAAACRRRHEAIPEGAIQLISTWERNRIPSCHVKTLLRRLGLFVNGAVLSGEQGFADLSCVCCDLKERGDGWVWLLPGAARVRNDGLSALLVSHRAADREGDTGIREGTRRRGQAEPVSPQ